MLDAPEQRWLEATRLLGLVVVLNAPEQRWLEAKRLLGLVVVLNAPEQRWLEAKRLLGSNAGSAPEDRGRTRSANC